MLNSIKQLKRPVYKITTMASIVNKGTGAGGSKTNENGLPYEEITNLNDRQKVIKNGTYSKTISFDDNKIEFIKTEQSRFMKYMDDKMDKSISKAHGCKNPDECYINEKTKIIFIIEKKFQQTSGSVCEKIQTPHFKIWHYKRSFPEYKIVYMYCLSDWFMYNCVSEIEYLSHFNIPFFWGNHKTYKDEIIKFIINYK